MLAALQGFVLLVCIDVRVHHCALWLIESMYVISLCPLYDLDQTDAGVLAHAQV